MLIISGITYFISRKFINYSLRGLRDIAKFVQHINPNNLEERLVVRGPKDDEIRQISAAINTSLDQIEQHNHQLKSFVQFASHELKTPLMTLSAQLDLLERNNDVNTFIIHQKFQINQYNKLLEKLLLISQHEYQITQLQPIDIVPIITSIIDTYKQQLDHKSIYRIHPGTYITNIDIFLFQSCITNLLQNAHHYSS
jgi:signal transduction histidine kinase